MLKSCSTCGGIHDFNAACPKRIEYKQKRHAQYDKSKDHHERDSRADKFRSTKDWQRKREEIRARDMNVCRVCFLTKHRMVTSGLSVHHIVPIDKNYRLRLTDSNLITLCRECHEQAESGRIAAETLRKLTVERLKIRG